MSGWSAASVRREISIPGWVMFRVETPSGRVEVRHAVILDAPSVAPPVHMGAAVSVSPISWAWNLTARFCRHHYGFVDATDARESDRTIPPLGSVASRRCGSNGHGERDRERLF